MSENKLNFKLKVITNFKTLQAVNINTQTHILRVVKQASEKTEKSVHIFRQLVNQSE